MNSAVQTLRNLRRASFADAILTPKSTTPGRQFGPANKPKYGYRFGDAGRLTAANRILTMFGFTRAAGALFGTLSRVSGPMHRYGTDPNQEHRARRFHGYRLSGNHVPENGRSVARD